MADFIEYRQLIVKTAVELVNKGYLSATGGNISVRIPSHQALAVTPSNLDYLHMEVSDVCVLDLDLKPLAGERKPSIESAMHAAIYKTRPDVNAILHTHQAYPSALALIGKPIPALFDEQVRFLGREVNIIPYQPSGSGLLVEAVVKHVNDHHNAYLMANHGALVFGEDMIRAVGNVAVLDKCALAYLLTLCAGEKASRIHDAARETLFTQLRKDQEKYGLD